MFFSSWQAPQVGTAIVRALREAGHVATESPGTVAIELSDELCDCIAEADTKPLAGKAFEAMLDRLVAVLTESDAVAEIFVGDDELRNAMAALIHSQCGSGGADVASPEERREKLGRVRALDTATPTVILDDGTQATIDYEVFDASDASHGDRVRVIVSASGAVIQVSPLLTLNDAVAVLEEAGVLSGSADGHQRESGERWPSALFEEAWSMSEDASSSGRDAVFGCDHHYLGPSEVTAWLRSSGLRDAKVEAGPPEQGEPRVRVEVGKGPGRLVRPAGFDVLCMVNDVLRTENGRFRWYALPSPDSRLVCLRLDRPTAEKLGVGLFEE